MPERLPNPNNQPVELNRTSLPRSATRFVLGILFSSYFFYWKMWCSFAEHNIFKNWNSCCFSQC